MSWPPTCKVGHHSTASTGCATLDPSIDSHTFLQPTDKSLEAYNAKTSILKGYWDAQKHSVTSMGSSVSIRNGIPSQTTTSAASTTRCPTALEFTDPSLITGSQETFSSYANLHDGSKDDHMPAHEVTYNERLNEVMVMLSDIRDHLAKQAQSGAGRPLVEVDRSDHINYNSHSESKKGSNTVDHSPTHQTARSHAAEPLTTDPNKLTPLPQHSPIPNDSFSPPTPGSQLSSSSHLSFSFPTHLALSPPSHLPASHSPLPPPRLLSPPRRYSISCESIPGVSQDEPQTTTTIPSYKKEMSFSDTFAHQTKSRANNDAISRVATTTSPILLTPSSTPSMSTVSHSFQHRPSSNTFFRRRASLFPRAAALAAKRERLAMRRSLSAHITRSLYTQSQSCRSSLTPHASQLQTRSSVETHLTGRGPSWLQAKDSVPRCHKQGGQHEAVGTRQISPLNASNTPIFRQPTARWLLTRPPPASPLLKQMQSLDQPKITQTGLMLATVNTAPHTLTYRGHFPRHPCHNRGHQILDPCQLVKNRCFLPPTSPVNRLPDLHKKPQSNPALTNCMNQRSLTHLCSRPDSQLSSPLLRGPSPHHIIDQRLFHVSAVHSAVCDTLFDESDLSRRPQLQNNVHPQTMDSDFTDDLHNSDVMGTETGDLKEMKRLITDKSMDIDISTESFQTHCTTLTSHNPFTDSLFHDYETNLKEGVITHNRTKRNAHQRDRCPSDTHFRRGHQLIHNDQIHATAQVAAHRTIPLNFDEMDLKDDGSFVTERQSEGSLLSSPSTRGTNVTSYEADHINDTSPSIPQAINQAAKLKTCISLLTADTHIRTSTGTSNSADVRQKLGDVVGDRASIQSYDFFHRGGNGVGILLESKLCHEEPTSSHSLNSDSLKPNQLNSPSLNSRQLSSQSFNSHSLKLLSLNAQSRNSVTCGQSHSEKTWLPAAASLHPSQLYQPTHHTQLSRCVNRDTFSAWEPNNPIPLPQFNLDEPEAEEARRQQMTQESPTYTHTSITQNDMVRPRFSKWREHHTLTDTDNESSPVNDCGSGRPYNAHESDISTSNEYQRCVVEPEGGNSSHSSDHLGREGDDYASDIQRRRHNGHRSRKKHRQACKFKRQQSDKPTSQRCSRYVSTRCLSKMSASTDLQDHTQADIKRYFDDQLQNDALNSHSHLSLPSATRPRTSRHSRHSQRAGMNHATYPLRGPPAARYRSHCNEFTMDLPMALTHSAGRRRQQQLHVNQKRDLPEVDHSRTTYKPKRHDRWPSDQPEGERRCSNTHWVPSSSSSVSSSSHTVARCRENRHNRRHHKYQYRDGRHAKAIARCETEESEGGIITFNSTSITRSSTYGGRNHHYTAPHETPHSPIGCVASFDSSESDNGVTYNHHRRSQSVCVTPPQGLLFPHAANASTFHQLSHSRCASARHTSTHRSPDTTSGIVALIFSLAKKASSSITSNTCVGDPFGMGENVEPSMSTRLSSPNSRFIKHSDPYPPRQSSKATPLTTASRNHPRHQTHHQLAQDLSTSDNSSTTSLLKRMFNLTQLSQMAGTGASVVRVLLHLLQQGSITTFYFFELLEVVVNTFAPNPTNVSR
eukprot:GHVN01076683.1.p1 GENE.GHVN01076683.1~~GHVN01076683.1.p1  ORF type:complete len:1581 (-),score=255.29 GHVN01076683.1:2894-7636(-)